MCMRSYAVPKALLRKLRLCDLARCQRVDLVVASCWSHVRTSAQRYMKSRRIVMAKVIEFYIPRNFPKHRKWFPQLKLGKVIEFSVLVKKSA